jgi:hypothetical protein
MEDFLDQLLNLQLLTEESGRADRQQPQGRIKA